MKDEVLNIGNYLVKKTFTDLILENTFQAHSHPINKKRKFDEFEKSSPKIKEEDVAHGEISKKRKLEYVKTDNRNVKIIDLKEVLKISKFESQKNIEIEDSKVSKDEEKEETDVKDSDKKEIQKEIFQPNKITKFFRSRPSEKKDETNIESNKQIEKIQSEIKDVSDEKNLDLDESFSMTKNNIWISSIGLGEKNKFKLTNVAFKLGKYKHIGDKIESINASEYIVILKNFNKFELKFIYGLINKKKFVYLDYFLESSLHKSYKELNSEYIYEMQQLSCLDYDSSEDDLPFQKEKYKIFLHPSMYYPETGRKDAFLSIFKLLGVKEFEENIRQSDICIINKQNKDESYPLHVKLLNELYVFDCFYKFKVMDVNNWKYQPMLENSSKK